MSVTGLHGERIPTEEDRERGEALAMLVLVWLCFTLAFGALCWYAGRDHEAQLALDAFAREERAYEREELKNELLRIVVGQQEESLAYVMSVDERLAAEIARRFPTHPYVIAWKEADEP